MSIRLMKFLDKYPEGMTLGELRTTIDSEHESNKLEEQNILKEIEEKVSGKIFKLETEGVFGKEVIILKCTCVKDTFKDTNYETFYNIFCSSKLLFTELHISSEKDVVYFLNKGDVDEKLVEISIAEYGIYLDKYNKFDKLIKSVLSE